MFDTMDENGDGRLTLRELSFFLNKLGICLTEDELNCLVMGVSSSEDGSLTFDEFVGLYQSVVEGSIEEDDDDLMEAFKIYDLNEDGYISSPELEQVLCRLGLMERGGDYVEECRKMISRYDSNSDGVIDFSEFKNMMRKTSNSVQL
ncbi:hypothetical protein KI387_022468, partial [Taxus chinensis]